MPLCLPIVRKANWDDFHYFVAVGILWSIPISSSSSSISMNSSSFKLSPPSWHYRWICSTSSFLIHPHLFLDNSLTVSCTSSISLNMDCNSLSRSVSTMQIGLVWRGTLLHKETEMGTYLAVYCNLPSPGASSFCNMASKSYTMNQGNICSSVGTWMSHCSDFSKMVCWALKKPLG
jgi:hypothetical protein